MCPSAALSNPLRSAPSSPLWGSRHRELRRVPTALALASFDDPTHGQDERHTPAGEQCACWRETTLLP